MIEFTRRNVLHVVQGWGWEGEVRPAFVQDVARNLLSKIDEAQLAEEVTFRP